MSQNLKMSLGIIRGMEKRAIHGPGLIYLLGEERYVRVQVSDEDSIVIMRASDKPYPQGLTSFVDGLLQDSSVLAFGMDGPGVMEELARGGEFLPPEDEGVPATLYRRDGRNLKLL